MWFPSIMPSVQYTVVHSPGNVSWATPQGRQEASSGVLQTKTTFLLVSLLKRGKASKLVSKIVKNILYSAAIFNRNSSCSRKGRFRKKTVHWCIKRWTQAVLLRFRTPHWNWRFLIISIVMIRNHHFQWGVLNLRSISWVQCLMHKVSWTLYSKSDFLPELLLFLFVFCTKHSL